MVHLRIHVGVETILAGLQHCQLVFGCFAVTLISTIDLMLCKPYFHGTTSATELPFVGRVFRMGHAQKASWIRGLVHTQSFSVGPVNDAGERAHTAHLSAGKGF